MTNCSVAFAAFIKRAASAIEQSSRLLTMCPRFALLVATVIVPVPLLAQEATSSLKDCRALLKVARSEFVAPRPATITEDIPGGCRFTDVGVFLDASMVAYVDEMTLLSPDLLAVYPKNEVFLSADLTLKGLVLAPDLKLDLHLVYKSDPQARISTLERFSVDAGDLGRFTVSAQLSEFDNEDVDAPLSEQSGVIDEMLLALEDNGIVAEILLPVLGNSLDVIEDGRAATSATIRSLPPELISEDSAAAAMRFVNALPSPHGNWTVTFQSEEGLPISAFSAPSFHELISRLPADSHIRATADR